MLSRGSGRGQCAATLYYFQYDDRRVPGSEESLQAGCLPWCVPLGLGGGISEWTADHGELDHGREVGMEESQTSGLVTVVVVAFAPNSVVDHWSQWTSLWQEHAELRQEGASSSLLAWCNVPVQSYYVAPPIQSKCTVNRLHTVLTPCPAMPCPALLPCPAHFGLEHVPVAQH